MVVNVDTLCGRHGRHQKKDRGLQFRDHIRPTVFGDTTSHFEPMHVTTFVKLAV